MGYSNWGGLPFGETKIDFKSGSPVVSYYPIDMDFRHTHANISDTAGNLLFYTNGYYIADATHDTMQNGSGINPGAYANFVPDGFLIPQGALIIPKPGSSNLFYMFHNTLDNHPTPGTYSLSLYLTIVDMNLNGGKGAVWMKNYIVISDSLNTGKITACKHANGRDWWVISHKLNTNKYYKVLVTPYGLPTFTSQNIGLQRYQDAGQAKFSPDGTRFAYYHYFNGLDIMDFDRCTGMFSNVITDTSLPYIQGNVGCEFSPNSSLLYVCNILKVYQYDVTAANPLSTRMEVAVWDSFSQPAIPGLGAYLCIPQLAPDGKIYITTGNGTTYLGRINNPDVPGPACNVAQHSVLLPTYSFNTLPNHPNYFLGADTASACDSLGGVGIGEPPVYAAMAAWPNPTAGVVTFQFAVARQQGTLHVYDVWGQLVLQAYVAPWSQYLQVDLAHLPPGIYVARMQRGSAHAVAKIIRTDVPAR